MAMSNVHKYRVRLKRSHARASEMTTVEEVVQAKAITIDNGWVKFWVEGDSSPIVLFPEILVESIRRDTA